MDWLAADATREAAAVARSLRLWTHLHSSKLPEKVRADASSSLRHGAMMAVDIEIQMKTILIMSRGTAWFRWMKDRHEIVERVA